MLPCKYIQLKPSTVFLISIQNKVFAPQRKTSLLVKFPVRKRCKDQGSNTLKSFPPETVVTMIESPTKVPNEEIEDDSMSDISENDVHDTSFKEDDISEESYTEDELNDWEVESNFTQKFASSSFIVYWACLLPLFRHCFTCFCPARITKVVTKGSQLIIDLICPSNHSHKWFSQPMIRLQPRGNLILSSAMLISGNTYQRIKELMDIANVILFSKQTYYRLQKHFLFPAVHKIYTTHRMLRYQEYVESSNEIDLIGDGRCDSPGYNAKYGTYTLMNGQCNEILDCHVVHVGQVANSSRMEKEGLVKLLNRLDGEGLKIRSLSTDRHIQIRKYMREERNDIKHQFDVWHVSKSIKKKLVKVSRKNDTCDLQAWIKAIINHFWWCCASCEGNVLNLREKWLSILSHITNKHSWEGNAVYKKCEHIRLVRKINGLRNG